MILLVGEGVTIYKKILGIASVLGGMLLILYLMDITYVELKKAAGRNSENMFRFSYFMSLLGFLFGVLIEWKGVKRLLQKKLNPNWWLLLIAIILTCLSFIPRVYWISWFGAVSPFYIDMFLYAERNLMLTVLSGILFIRSLTYRDQL